MGVEYGWPLLFSVAGVLRVLEKLCERVTSVESRGLEADQVRECCNLP
jgi:hypothetical protein